VGDPCTIPRAARSEGRCVVESGAQLLLCLSDWIPPPVDRPSRRTATTASVRLGATATTMRPRMTGPAPATEINAKIRYGMSAAQRTAPRVGASTQNNGPQSRELTPGSASYYSQRPATSSCSRGSSWRVRTRPLIIWGHDWGRTGSRWSVGCRAPTGSRQSRWLPLPMPAELGVRWAWYILGFSDAR